MVLHEHVAFILTILAMLYNAFTDLRYSKIKNHTFIFCVSVGLVINSFFLGLGGLVVSLAGVGVMFVFIPLCYDKIPLIRGLRVIGMGDLKMFMSVGALLGVLDALVVIVIAYIWAAGVLALYYVCKALPVNPFARFFLAANNDRKKTKFAPYVFLGVIVYYFIRLFHVSFDTMEWMVGW